MNKYARKTNITLNFPSIFRFVYQLPRFFKRDKSLKCKVMLFSPKMLSKVNFVTILVGISFDSHDTFAHFPN